MNPPDFLVGFSPDLFKENHCFFSLHFKKGGRTTERVQTLFTRPILPVTEMYYLSNLEKLDLEASKKNESRFDHSLGN